MSRWVLSLLVSSLLLAAGCLEVPDLDGDRSGSAVSEDHSPLDAENESAATSTAEGQPGSHSDSEPEAELEPEPAQAQVPVIEAANVILETRSDAHYLTLHLEVVSNVEVDWLNYRFTGPAGNILGGGSGVHFEETSPNTWEYDMVHTISFCAPSGEYYWSGISVENVAELQSEDWEGPLSTTINNECAPEPPEIDVATATLEIGADAHYVTLHLEVESNVEVDWLNYRFTGPAGNILGGGSEIKFDETSPSVWEYDMIREVSFCAPSGEYYWSGISVENVGEMESEEWSGSLAVTINNDCEPEVPVIELATATLETRSDAHYVTLHLEVASNVEVDWLNYRFTGPAGNILGGGSGVRFDEATPDIWEYEMVRKVSFDAPTGDYYWSSISVENVGELESETWSGELSVYIDNG